MAEKGPRRLFVEDARGNGHYLRITWHPDGEQFVVSTWQADVCTGAVRVDPAGAARLVGHLAHGLAERMDSLTAPPTAPPPLTLRDRLRRWLRRSKPGPETSTVVDLDARRSA